MAGFSDAPEQIKQFWATRTTGQKGFLLAGAGATVLLLALFVQLIGTPDYKPLYTGLEAADAQTLTAQLDAQGIPHQASADGKTISVPADKLDAARLQTAAQGAPHSGRMGFELFDKASWGQTEFDEKVTYQRALEGELERTIETLSDVESARVHIVMPTDSVFADNQRGAKASVILKLRHDTLSKDAVLAISRLVSGAVDQLKPEDVSIVDADSDRSLGLGHDGEADGEATEAVLAQRLIATLEPVVGVDKIRASVNVVYDQDTTDETQQKYDPTVSAVLSEQKSQDQIGAGAPSAGGVPGIASNVPANQGKTASPAQSPGQTSMTESAEYGVNKVETHTLVPAGRIQRVTAAIVVDDAVVRNVVGGKTSYVRQKRSQDELDRIQQLAQGVIGFDAKRGDTITVQDMSFDTPVTAADLPAPNLMERAQKELAGYSSLLRPLSLLGLFLLAYMFVLRPVQKKALAPVQMTAQPVLASAPKVERLGIGSGVTPGDTQRATQLKEQTIELIKQKPVNTARAVQAWLREEPS
ncbi:MAG: flagellar basal-body MS-ring/collar protein FliF [Acidobacteriaceae bacterium]